jgi:hypothetical protein
MLIALCVIGVSNISTGFRKEGSLGPAELSVLSSWYDWLENNLNIHLDLIVYLRYVINYRCQFYKFIYRAV